eukprot:CAMPEP_0197827194 /NCGR_PEP_ID=MMETSP1437-20131217/4026_1 /TAXON_ID=49252 ORGANISM="Eucampia antarctica, Strain CCMP1452" /NCGR_SAMPLE_ID=MMETSP1437 /ASSEMBLY_ACC=CAM_ASM_001096 /LENGTH=613 /DNA_ID=CAMNT_0043427945 /DNA_START=128 /DNA_END=1969 /DNA_ORIENTATION=+
MTTSLAPSSDTILAGNNSSFNNNNSSSKHTNGLSCAWESGSVLNLHVYITEDENPLTDKMKKKNKDKILAEWHPSNVYLYDTSNNKEANITIPLTHSVQYNESDLYAHVEVVRLSNNDDDKESSSVMNNFHQSFLLTKHKVRKRQRVEKSLLDSSSNSNSSNEVDEIDDTTTTTQSKKVKTNIMDNPLTLANLNTTHAQNLLYLRPTLTLQWVPQAFTYPNKDSVPEAISKHMTSWVNETSYHPILYRSEFWTTNDQLILVNETVTQFPLTISLETTSMWKWQLMSQMEASWENQKEESEDAANDIFRTMLLETNPYLLIITAFVSVLHTVFDILAFKNDISFFKNKKSMAGLSLRSMIVNAIFQFIILLYLADNDTSYMVLMSNGMGLVIEVWKISKAVKLDIDIANRSFALVWRENDNDNSDNNAATSDLHAKTREYDDIAMTHLIYVAMPLVAGYGLYSLFHRKHKGWISWILNTLVGFIYLFGFINMTPQLFINYKLKSVAHLNWRTLSYKSINTFIDDLFAFVIKMPIMHRLACLRDDLIFFIYCYQRYIYKTDYTRVNEYGQCTQPTKDMLKEQEQLKLTATSTPSTTEKEEPAVLHQEATLETKKE